MAKVTIECDDQVELARKLQAEATYAGFDVTMSSSDAPDAMAPASVSAVTFHVDSAERVTLAFATPHGAPGASQVLTMSSGEGNAFPWRVVEFVRAHLVDLGWEVPQSPEALPTDDSTTPAAPTSDPPNGNTLEVSSSSEAEVTSANSMDVSLWLGVGPGAVFAVGGLVLRRWPRSTYVRIFIRSLA